MSRSLIILAALLLGLGCGRSGLEEDVRLPFAPCDDCVDTVFFPDAGPPSATGDAGVDLDAGLSLPCGNTPIGPDCCANGARVSSATCEAGAWTCGGAAFCTCEGVPQTFSCTDVCGSDAFLSPVCANGQWSCARPFIETTLCAPDLCWGEPGDCCGAPSCVDGGWVCGFKPAGC